VDDNGDEVAGGSHKRHGLDGCSTLAKVRVAGSSPVVRFKQSPGQGPPSRSLIRVRGRVRPTLTDALREPPWHTRPKTHERRARRPMWRSSCQAGAACLHRERARLAAARRLAGGGARCRGRAVSYRSPGELRGDGRFDPARTRT